MRRYGRICRVADCAYLDNLLERHFVAETDAQFAHAMIDEFFSIFQLNKGVGRDVADRYKVVLHDLMVARMPSGPSKSCHSAKNSYTAAMITLEVQERGKGAADDVRRRGFVPAVVYGRKDSSTPIAIDARQFERVWKEAGHTSVVQLTGVGAQKETLIKDVQLHPVSGRLVHADFYALEKGKKIKISVPLEFIGEAPAEKAGHIIVKALHEVEIDVAPAELPHTLPVDLAKLENVGDHILAADIKLPGSATLVSQGEDIVASVTAFVEEKEQTPAASVPAGTDGATAAAAKAEGADAPAEQK